MIPRLDIRFPLRRQWQYWCGEEYTPKEGEYLLNHARTGIALALKATLPNGGRVGVVAYNCHTVANAVGNAGCTPVFLDVTDELKIDLNSMPDDLDAIVVTNLFGIRNDISAIRAKCPKAIIIVDNAHGYGLPAEGDFTVYSINQGKFPALGPGGILVRNKRMSELENERIKTAYNALPTYTKLAQVELFIQMMAKAIAYSRCFYWLTRKMKRVNELKSEGVKGKVVMRKMAPGIRRLYNAWLPSANEAIAAQKQNAERISGLGVSGLVDEWLLGDNAFMLVAKTQNPEALNKWFDTSRIETETHFKHAVDWEKEFGYNPGTRKTAERLTKELLMIPTYVGF